MACLNDGMVCILYLTFYNLLQSPFELTPDPRFLFFTDAHQEAYAQMVLGVKMRKGFVMLTGEAGTGKTTLIHAVLKELQPHVKCALIFHTLFSAKGLFQNICKEFGLSILAGSKTDYVLQLHDFLRSQHEFARATRQDANTVVILDEAHNLDSEILEEIRLLSNFEIEHKKLLQIMLVGQPELQATIKRPELRQLNQRIGLRFSLRRFSPSETATYVAHRLRIAGLPDKQNVFHPSALRRIHEYSEGIARRINVLCENALMMGYVRGADVITEEIVSQVKAEDFHSEMESALETPSRQEPLWQPVRRADRFFSNIETLMESPPEQMVGLANSPAAKLETSKTSGSEVGLSAPSAENNDFPMVPSSDEMDVAGSIAPRNEIESISSSVGDAQSITDDLAKTEVDNHKPAGGWPSPPPRDNSQREDQKPDAADGAPHPQTSSQAASDAEPSSSEMAAPESIAASMKKIFGRDVTRWLLYLVVAVDVLFLTFILAAWRGC
jgi:type II secretory pathway predicted ATPase ExeA